MKGETCIDRTLQHGRRRGAGQGLYDMVTTQDHRIAIGSAHDAPRCYHKMLLPDTRPG